MAKVFVQTYGCSLNQADGEQMHAVLEQDGYEFARDMDSADVIVLNSCAVKGPTESKFFTLLKKLSKQNKKVVVAGCISQSMPERVAEYSKIGTEQIPAVSEVVARTLQGEVVTKLEDTHTNKLTVPSKRLNPLIEIIPISAGCLSLCTYCITKHARGELTSYPVNDILKRVRAAKRDGVKEIYLTSPDNGCYGFEHKTNLAQLVKEIASIKGDFMIRIGMGNPQHILRYVDAFAEVLSLPNVYAFAHIPVQAGSDAVLRDMKRGYRRRHYVKLIHALQEKVPRITIATDIIIGFPTETEEHFEQTLSLLDEAQPDIVNVSRFWPRPHTEAAKLPEIPGGIVKERTIRFVKAFEATALQKNKNYIGEKISVLITEKGKKGTMIGRNKSYKQVIVPDFCVLGKRYEVTITDCTPYYLVGDVV